MTPSPNRTALQKSEEWWLPVQLAFIDQLMFGKPGAVRDPHINAIAKVPCGIHEYELTRGWGQKLHVTCAFHWPWDTSETVKLWFGSFNSFEYMETRAGHQCPCDSPGPSTLLSVL